MNRIPETLDACKPIPSITDRRLAPNHRDELVQGSGISPEVIAARGAYTAQSPAELEALGYKGDQAQLVPALVLPVHSLNGWKPTYVIKPDKPRPDTHRDGTPKIKPDGTPKMRKYEYAAGSPNRLDVPPGTQAVAEDPSVPVLITEGIKKVDKATAAGYHCIGLGGVWSWLGKHDTPYGMPLPDFGYFAWKGRRVAIVFDSDVAVNKNVCEARRRLKLFLESLSAVVLFIDLPPAADGAKMGLDDYLVTNPNARLWDMAYDPVEREVTRLRAELVEERRNKSAMMYALRNPKIKAERVALVATVNYLEMKHTYDQTPPVELPGKGGGWYDVPRAAIAEQAGCGEKTAGGHMDSGAQWDLYEKTLDWDPRRHVDADGVIVAGPKRIFMRRLRPATASLDLLATLDPPKGADKDTWGGKREVTCPDHPTAGTVKKWTLHCQECDRALDSGETYQRPKYHDDTPPDEHAEELVDALPTPMDQDDPQGGIGQDDLPSSKGIGQDDLPSSKGTTYHPPVTPTDQDDPYPPVPCKYASVPEPPPYEAGYLESLAGTAPPAQAEPDLDVDPWPKPAPTVTLHTGYPLGGVPGPAAAPACNSSLGDCSEPTYCAKQGKCRWAPQAGSTR